ncbi:uncharacterized protein LOC129895502 [Solanum dulcamara]|uniref:uncharacterized protein LOC129895502 n=1 Tax=Solanum dulcamara TaxID=45834 RepID=UPI002485C414|nr:uncharacterized protein LOC129895502 [Solanum dulcamara]
MMSIFSSFDALSAEMLGQKVSRSWATATSDNKQQQQRVGPLGSNQKIAASPPSTSSTGELNKAGEAAPPSCPRQQRRPRCAPELDGVHCFETILPY